jgi:hypothetical protein
LNKKILAALIIVPFLLAITISATMSATGKTSADTKHRVYLESVNGYLEGKEAQQSFTVYCKDSAQNFEFTQPEEDADFWVKVLGRDDNFLEDFRLADGEIIILKGGGKFTMVIRSEDGSGAWSCKPITAEEAK